VTIMPVHMMILRCERNVWNQATLVDHVGNITW